MKIGIIGATGKAGSLIAQEAITRQHEVTGIVRNKAKVTTDMNVLEKDLFDLIFDHNRFLNLIINNYIYLLHPFDLIQSHYKALYTQKHQHLIWFQLFYL